MKLNKILGLMLVGLCAFILTGCDDIDDPVKPDDGETFVRRPLEPDEYGPDTMTQLPGDYTLVWADEFNYTGAVDGSKWNYELGASGWGNNEVQRYTNSLENSFVSDGHLTIRAIKQGNEYTSARITSKQKGDFKYGKIEARMKLTSTRGTWPAFWMMPTNSVYGGWPNSGEIDIMEFVGSDPTRIFGTTHSAVSQGGGIGRKVSCPTASTDWNTFGLEWDENSMKFLLNGTVYFTFNRLSSWDYRNWPFDQEFFLIFNLAIGGNLGGAIDPNFTQDEIQVDYVRVYKHVDKTDKELPSKVEFITSMPGSTSAVIDWEPATDNQGIKHYEIVVNNKQVGATVSRSYLIDNLEPDKSYNVRVIAVDYNDNWSISDTITIKTLSEQKIPGKILGVAFSEIEGDAIVTSTVAKDNVLQVKTGTSVTYKVTCTKSGNYSIGFHLQPLLNGEIHLKVYSSTTLLSEQSINVNRSYGSYVDIALTNKVNLPSGELSIVVTFTSAQSGNAMQLSYIEIV